MSVRSPRDVSQNEFLPHIAEKFDYSVSVFFGNVLLELQVPHSFFTLLLILLTSARMQSQSPWATSHSRRKRVGQKPNGDIAAAALVSKEEVNTVWFATENAMVSSRTNAPCHFFVFFTFFAGKHLHMPRPFKSPPRLPRKE